MSILEILENYLKPLGFEIYPFKVGWYNDSVSEAFKFSLHYDTLSFVVLSTPKMFEKTFKEFIAENTVCGQQLDPLDHCLKTIFNQVKQKFPENKVEIIHDFELHHSRRPKILVQTAGHVASAAFYYQRKHLTNDPWPSQKKIYGVSIHPKYGGWFAFRGVLIFEDVLTDIQRSLPIDVIGDESKIVTLLELFNESWEDSRFRDIIDPIDRYSYVQKLYFRTKPGERAQILELIKNS